MPTFLEPNSITYGRSADQHYTVYSIGAGREGANNKPAAGLPQGATLADLFRPDFWKNVAHVLMVDDQVRVKTGDFDFTVNVAAKEQGGIRMEFWPKLPTAADLDAAAEVSAAAERARKKLAGRVLNGKKVPRVENPARVGGDFRVIALDGNALPEGYRTYVDAYRAQKRYEKSLGLDLPDDPVSAPPGAMGSAAVAEGDGTDAPAPEPAAKQPRKGGQFAKKQLAEVAAEAEDVA